MYSGPFPPLPKDPSHITFLAATGIRGANGSFPPNEAGDSLPAALQFNKQYAHYALAHPVHRFTLSGFVASP